MKGIHPFASENVRGYKIEGQDVQVNLSSLAHSPHRSRLELELQLNYVLDIMKRNNMGIG